MRKWKRAIARASMQRNKITKINKDVIGPDGRRMGSFFSRYWRQYAAMPIQKWRRRKRKS